MSRLFVHGQFFKFLSTEKIPKYLPHAFNSLKFLYLVDFNFGDFVQLQGALCLLQNSPNLESIHIFDYHTINSRFGDLVVKYVLFLNLIIKLDFKSSLPFVSFQEPLLMNSDAFKLSGIPILLGPDIE
ncbi:hypothetical protein Tco_0981178 [Tanacetum coccineum]